MENVKFWEGGRVKRSEKWTRGETHKVTLMIRSENIKKKQI